MKTGMSIGGLDMSSVEDPAKDITTIMEGHSSEVIVLAGLATYAKIAKVENCTIQNCNITGDKTLNIDSDLNIKEGE